MLGVRENRIIGYILLIIYSFRVGASLRFGCGLPYCLLCQLAADVMGEANR